jgi:hypothetical protein
MSADIEKLAVYDDRIVQSRPKYAVEKGALSITNSPFNAIAVNSSQHTYNILCPSENVFIDRAVDWTSQCFLQVDVTLLKTTETNEPIFLPGRDFALCAFPLQSMTNTMTATINDTTVTINSGDVLPQVLRMTDYKFNRLIRTCPTMLDKYKNYSDSEGAVNSPLYGYNAATATDEVPNGAYWNVSFTNSQGQPLLSGATQAGSGTFQGWTADALGRPCPTATGAAGDQYRLYVTFTSTEKLVLSPFVFSDSHEWDCGLFGCQNIQLVMNMQPPSRVLRSFESQQGGQAYASTTVNSAINWGSVVYNPNTNGFTGAQVNIQFLTPSLDISLPPKSIVPYMEFPRYITSQLSVNPGLNVLNTQTIVLPMMPDLLMIWCRPQSYTYNNSNLITAADNAQGDWVLPIQKINLNLDNYAGLLSAHTQNQLYKISVNNGLEVDYNQWVGKAKRGPIGGITQTSNDIPMSGGMLVLKPGRDIALQTGIASGIVGNFVLQAQLTVENTSANTFPVQIYIVTANSGFFETIKGSSRVIKGVLTEQDIISAPVAPAGTHGQVRRMVGAGVLGKLGNAVSAIKDLYHQSKPAVTAVKNCLSATGNETAGRVAGALGKVGYGRRGHHDLSDRLM